MAHFVHVSGAAEPDPGWIRSSIRLDRRCRPRAAQDGCMDLLWDGHTDIDRGPRHSRPTVRGRARIGDDRPALRARGTRRGCWGVPAEQCTDQRVPLGRRGVGGRGHSARDRARRSRCGAGRRARDARAPGAAPTPTRTPTIVRPDRGPRPHGCNSTRRSPTRSGRPPTAPASGARPRSATAPRR